MIQPHTLRITSIEQLVAATEQAYRPERGMAWWRGQGQAWPLLPKVYRRPHWTKYENGLTVRFVNQARSRHAPCPDVLATMIGDGYQVAVGIPVNPEKS
jgi:hypothetical protein